MTRLFTALKTLALLLLTAEAVAQTPRIVAITPALSDTLVALGLGNKMVGRDQASDHPSIRHLPVIADYQRVNLEALLALQPTHVVAWEDSLPPYLGRQLEPFGVELLISRTSSLQTWRESTTNITQHLSGDAHVPEAWWQQLQGLRSEYGMREPVTIAWLIWDRPLMVAGGRGYIDEAIRLCGGQNLFSTIDATNPTIERERLIRSQPQMMVGDAQWLSEFSPWSSIPAVSKDGFWSPPPDLLSRPGPSLVEGIRALCKAIDKRREAL